MPGLDSILGPTIEELLVQGARQSLSQSLSHALSGAVSGSLANLAGSGAFSNLKFSSPDLQAAVARAQSQLPQDQSGVSTPPSSTPAGAAPSAATPTDIGELVVHPSVQTGGGALGQVISGASGAGNIGGGAAEDALSSQSSQRSDSSDAPVDLEGVTAVAPRASPNPSLDPALLSVPAFLGGASLLSGPNVGPMDTTTPIEQQTAEPNPTMDPALLAAPALLGGAALLAGPQAPAFEGGGGFDPKTLLPLAPLVPLVTGLPGAGGGAGPGTPGDALKGLADNSANLANRLGNIATSGFAGDIGGRGLNSINRMVTKAQAAIRQRYAAMGMSGSTAEEQDLQAAADSGVDLQFKIGQEMAQTGLNAIAALTGQSASIYTSLLNAQTAKDTALGNTYASFIGSLTTFLGGLGK